MESIAAEMMTAELATAADIDRALEAVLRSGNIDKAALPQMTGLCDRALGAATALGHERGITRARLARVQLRLFMGDASVFGEDLGELRAQVEADGDAANRVLAACIVGALAFYQGDLDGLESALDSVEDDAGRIDDDVVAAIYLNRRAAAAYVRGDIEELLRHQFEALAAAERAGAELMMVAIFNNLGEVQNRSGGYDDALDMLSESVEICARIDVAVPPIVVATLADAHRGLGDYRTASDLLDPVMDHLRDSGDTAGIAYAALIGADLATRTGDWDKAERLLASAPELAQSDAQYAGRVMLLTVQGAVARARGDLDGSLRLLHEALALLDEQGDNGANAAPVWEALAATHKERADWQSAFDAMERHLQASRVARTASMSSRRRFHSIRSEVRHVIAERDAALELAHGDPLTGLRNRRHFDALMDRLVAEPHEVFSLGFLDIDHFKSVNDRYGHDMGDAVLRALAVCMRDRVRSSDVIARIGGEEFCVVFPGLDAEAAGARLRHVLDAFTAWRIVHGDAHVEGLTFSAGVAEFPRHAQDAAGLLAAADEALYAVKRTGRGDVRVAG